MIRDSDDERLMKRLTDLYNCFQAAGFLPQLLNKADYYNYIAYLFENPLINDFYYVRGAFSYLNQVMEYDHE
jgi:hypothetical protein